MNIIINFIIFIIVLYLYLHIIFQLKINNDLEILEIEELSKEQLEEICDLRQPVLFKFDSPIKEKFNFENLLNEFSAFDVKIRNIKDDDNESEIFLPLTLKESIDLLEKDTKKKYISEKNIDFLEETSLVKNLNNNDLFFRPPFVSYCLYDIFFGYKDTYTPFRYDIYYRNYMLVSEGKIIVRLTPPKNERYLHVKKDYEILEFKSDIDIWNVEDKYKKDYDKIKCLDIELTKGSVLYIPAYWFYSIKYVERSIICNFKYSTFMNNIATLPNYIMYFLQHNNTKKQLTDIKKLITPLT